MGQQRMCRSLAFRLRARAVSSLGRLLATCSPSLSILAPACPLLLPITQTMLFPSTLLEIEVQGQEDWGRCTWTQ